MAEPSPFTLKIIAAIRKIPRGQVATYGQVAALAGQPRGSRTVVWVLHSLSQKYRLPWHRVINAKGKIAFAPHSLEFQRQWRRLTAEGIAIDAQNGKIDLKHYQYRKMTMSENGEKKPRPRSKRKP